MIPLTFTLSAVNVAALDAARDRLTDLTPAMLAIASYLESEVQTRFESATDPQGQPWLPSRRVIEEGGQTLVKSGHLLSRIASRADATSAEVGTDVPYANIHNAGGTIRPREGKRALRTPFGPRASVNMPKRQFIGFSEADKIEVPQLIADFLSGDAHAA